MSLHRGLEMVWRKNTNSLRKIEKRKLKMYLSESDKEKIIEICRRNDVSYCAVFGSYARGEATEASDVDLLVKFSKPIGWVFYGIAEDLETALGRKVDLATDRMIGKYIRESVMRDLQVIYEETERRQPSPAYS